MCGSSVRSGRLRDVDDELEHQDLRSRLPRCLRCGGIVATPEQGAPVQGREGRLVHRDRCKPAPGRPPGKRFPHRVTAAIDDVTLSRLRELDPESMSEAIRVAAELASKCRSGKQKRKRA